MPPKKAAATTKVGTKATSGKKVQKESSVELEDEVPEKNVRKNPVRKGRSAKEEQIEDHNEELPEKKKKTATSASTSKKETLKEKSSKNGTTKTKVVEEEVEETEKVPSSSKPKKAAASRAKRGKKAENSEEESSDPKPAKKAKPTPANATLTTWENVNFKCTSKAPKGEQPNFHITSWNVDGLRAWLKKGGLDILRHDQPDIFCIQETKCSLEKLPEEVTDIEGYETLWCCSDKEGYAGVGVITKSKPLSVIYGINSEEHDTEGRCITAEFDKFFLVNVYVPNAGRKLVTLPKRLEWNKLFKTFVKQLDDRKPVIICGDMNVAHEAIDLANPKTNTKNAGFTVEEREGMTDFLGDGYVDTFRHLYPDKEKAYTFWSFMSNARAKDIGWRLDYFIVSQRLLNDVCDNLIHSDVLGSDHCPLSLHLNI